MMLTRRARLQRQAQREREDLADQHARPGEPSRAVPLKDQCPGALGRAHDFTMQDRDGALRCWYCAKAWKDHGRKSDGSADDTGPSRPRG